MRIKLKAIRINLGLSREQAAEQLGIELRRYCSLERGKTRMLANEFVAIHEKLGIPWDNIEP